MQEPVRRRRSLLTRPAARFRLALGIWGALGLLACILYARRYSAVELTLPQLLMAIMLSGFAGMLGYFAWLMYVPTLRRGDDDVFPFAKLLAGLATLVPPALIGVALLPAGSHVIPWFVGFGLIVGCFALLSPHQEYLFARHTQRTALAESPFRGSALPVIEPVRPADFSSLAYRPGYLAAAYARAMIPTEDVHAFRPEAGSPGSSDRVSARRVSEPVPAPAPAAPLPAAQPSDDVFVQPKLFTSPLQNVPAPVPVESPPVPVADVGTQGTATERVLPVRDVDPVQRRMNKKQRRLERRRQQLEAEADASAITSPDAAPVVAAPVSEPPTPEAPRRFVDDDAADCVEGIAQAVFQPGQKRAYAHVPFHPTFAGTPDVVCDVLDDADVRLRSPQVFPYGTRLEVTRRENLRERQVVRIGFLARLEPGA